MGEIRTVLIAGAGAIGSMVAWQCHRASPGSVGILAGGERLGRYRATGFTVNGERLPFPLVDARGASTPDLVIVACKNHHLGQVIRDLKNHVGPDTLIMSLLNGISSEEELAAAYGKERIPYAMIIGTDAGHRDGVTTFSKTGTIYFGDAQNAANGGQAADAGASSGWSPRVAAIAEFFDRVGIAYAVPADMYNRLWYKFMMNVGLNQVTAILRAPYRLLKTATKVSEAAELLEAAMREVRLVGAAEGVTLTDEDVSTVYRTIDTLSDGGKTSMCQDVEAGRKTEVELFAGTVIALGARHGIPVPVNETLYRIIRSIELTY